MGELLKMQVLLKNDEIYTDVVRIEDWETVIVFYDIHGDNYSELKEDVDEIKVND